MQAVSLVDGPDDMKETNGLTLTTSQDINDRYPLLHALPALSAPTTPSLSLARPLPLSNPDAYPVCLDNMTITEYAASRRAEWLVVGGLGD